jgi:hypothetical protein
VRISLHALAPSSAVSGHAALLRQLDAKCDVLTDALVFNTRANLQSLFDSGDISGSVLRRNKTFMILKSYLKNMI